MSATSEAAIELLRTTDLKQTEIAAQLGVYPNYISRIAKAAGLSRPYPSIHPRRKKAVVENTEPDGYVEKRDRLIRFATRHANDLHGKNPGTGDREEWGEKWSLAFHRKMNELAREAGLTSF